METRHHALEPRTAPRRTATVSVGIPAYSRCQELIELFASIFAQTVLPREITICEDNSPERTMIRSIVGEWRGQFETEGCIVNYHENIDNLGFDGNLRKVIEVSSSPWVMLMGNDDIMLKPCIEIAEQYLNKNPGLTVVSRSFVRFDRDINHPVGFSRNDSSATIYKARISSSKMIFRTCGFIGGLIIDRQWATSLSTVKYDGTLYYQIYLACFAFCETGIGYIADPIVGARGGNPPLFGAAATERGIHSPGSYSPKGRAKMWESVLRIAHEVGQQCQVDLETDLRKELEVRQAFHVFEMYTGADKAVLRNMRDELTKLGLFNHLVPRLLYTVNRVFGRRASIFYVATRSLMQGR